MLLNILWPPNCVIIHKQSILHKPEANCRTLTMLQHQITHVPDVDNANVYSHRWIRMMNQWLCEMCRSTSDSVVSIKSANHQNAQIIFLQRCFQENKLQKCFLRSLTTYKVINIKFFQVSRFAICCTFCTPIFVDLVSHLQILTPR